MFVPTIIFLVVVAPIWLVLHYRFKTKMASGLSEREHGSIDALLDQLDKLVDRIETLESILDQEHPSWRKKTKTDGENE